MLQTLLLFGTICLTVESDHVLRGPDHVLRIQESVARERRSIARFVPPPVQRTRQAPLPASQAFSGVGQAELLAAIERFVREDLDTVAGLRVH
jgi:hypothetical protein